MPVNKLQFWGTRHRPMSLEETVTAAPQLGTGDLPEELRRMAARREFFVTGDQPPELQVTEVESSNGTSAWRVSIDANGSGHRMGMSALRSAPEEITAQIDENVDTSGRRPDWSHLLYQPRVVPRQIGLPLARINGRRLRPLYIFGSDDRQVFQDTSYPWHCCGKLYNSDGFMGSASLVSGNTIVTAGHMVPWNGVGAGSWWMKFVPDYYDGQSLMGAGVESYVSDIRGYNTGVAGYDWAVGKLFNRLGDSLGFFGYNGYSSDWENDNYWTVVGYPVDVAGAERPSWQGSISIHDDDDDSNGGQELESQTADVNHGDSGGPIFGWWSGDPRVIGVVSGEEEEYHFPFSTEDNNVFSSGSGFTNLIAWARTNW